MRKNFGAKPYLYPQPVMIIGTYDENGNANAMNAAWGGMAGANKIMIDLSSHKTTDNIQLNRAFTVSVGDVKHLTACDYVGMVSAHNAPDKMEKAGFTTTKSDFVNSRRLQTVFSPANTIRLPSLKQARTTAASCRSSSQTALTRTAPCWNCYTVLPPRKMQHLPRSHWRGCCAKSLISYQSPAPGNLTVYRKTPVQRILCCLPQKWL